MSERENEPWLVMQRETEHRLPQAVETLNRFRHRDCDRWGILRTDGRVWVQHSFVNLVLQGFEAVLIADAYECFAVPQRAAETDALRAALEPFAAFYDAWVAAGRSVPPARPLGDELYQITVRGVDYCFRLSDCQRAREALATAGAVEDRSRWGRSITGDPVHPNAWRETVGMFAGVPEFEPEALAGAAPCVPLEHVRDIQAQTLRRAAQVAREYGECNHVEGPCNKGIAAELERMAEGSA